jgi:hypothetical protein
MELVDSLSSNEVKYHSRSRMIGPPIFRLKSRLRKVDPSSSTRLMVRASSW